MDAYPFVTRKVIARAFCLFVWLTGWLVWGFFGVFFSHCMQEHVINKILLNLICKMKLEEMYYRFLLCFLLGQCSDK